MAKTAHIPPSLKGPHDPVFTRGQLEWAIWHMPGDTLRGKPPPRFKLKIKHLLQLDRSEPLTASSSMAFSDEPPEGSGAHSLLSVFDALMVAIALGLLGLGFKRQEVVLYLRSRRAHLRKSAGPILARRLKQLKSERSPAKAAKPRAASAPERLMLFIPNMDPSQDKPKLGRGGVFSAEEAAKALADDFGHLAVIDLTIFVSDLPPALLKAPLRRRGRVSGQ